MKNTGYIVLLCLAFIYAVTSVFCDKFEKWRTGVAPSERVRPIDQEKIKQEEINANKMLDEAKKEWEKVRPQQIPQSLLNAKKRYLSRVYVETTPRVVHWHAIHLDLFVINSGKCNITDYELTAYLFDEKGSLVKTLKDGFWKNGNPLPATSKKEDKFVIPKFKLSNGAQWNPIHNGYVAKFNNLRFEVTDVKFENLRCLQ